MQPRPWVEEWEEQQAERALNAQLRIALDRSCATAEDYERHEELARRLTSLVDLVAQRVACAAAMERNHSHASPSINTDEENGVAWSESAAALAPLSFLTDATADTDGTGCVGLHESWRDAPRESMHSGATSFVTSAATRKEAHTAASVNALPNPHESLSHPQVSRNDEVSLYERIVVRGDRPSGALSGSFSAF